MNTYKQEYYNNIIKEDRFYFNYKTIKPVKYLNKVKNVCLKTPFTDWFLLIYVLVSFFQLEIKQGQKNKYLLKRSDYNFKDLYILIKENWKQYVILSVIITTILNITL